MALVLLLGHVRYVRRLVVPERELVTDSVRYGVKAAGTSLVESHHSLDYLLVTPIVGVEAIGLFSVSDQIVAVLGWGGLVAGRMMLAESARDSQGDNARRKLGLGVRILLFVVGLAALGAAALGWWLIPVVFGAEFADVHRALISALRDASGASAWSAPTSSAATSSSRLPRGRRGHRRGRDLRPLVGPRLWVGDRWGSRLAVLVSSY